MMPTIHSIASDFRHPIPLLDQLADHRNQLFCIERLHDPTRRPGLGAGRIFVPPGPGGVVLVSISEF
jgi:hypothetical protein